MRGTRLWSTSAESQTDELQVMPCRQRMGRASVELRGTAATTTEVATLLAGTQTDPRSTHECNTPAALRTVVRDAKQRRDTERTHNASALRDQQRGVFRSMRDFGQYWRAIADTARLPPAERDFYRKNLETPLDGPELALSSLSTADIVKAWANDRTLILTSRSIVKDVAHIAPCITITATTNEQIRAARAFALERGLDRIIAVGGCTVGDVGKAVAVGKELLVVPTVLSTNCASDNRTVEGSGVSSGSFQTTTPLAVGVSISDIMSKPAEFRAHWTQSGFGDFFAAISAYIDRDFKNGELGVYSPKRHEQEIFAALDWVQRSFVGYNEDAVRRFAAWTHESGWKDLELGTNKSRIGGEHAFYKTLLEVKPSLRTSGATHGQIVAIGTLITTHIYALRTGDHVHYAQVRAAFTKLGLPTTWEQLAALKISRDELQQGLALLKGSKSLLEDHVTKHGFASLDQIFGAPGAV